MYFIPVEERLMYGYDIRLSAKLLFHHASLSPVPTHVGTFFIREKNDGYSKL